MNQNRFTLWYFSIAVVFIVLENLNFVFPSLVFKALIIPSLMIFYHFLFRGMYDLFHRMIMTGLFFSWVGDVILELTDKPFMASVSPDLLFIGGLLSFLFTHLIFMVSFSLSKGKPVFFTIKFYQLVLVLLYGAVMLYYLYRGLGDMKIPVIVYTAIILLMLLSALNRYGKVNGLSYILVVIGALLFVISDSLIAVNKFHMKIDFAGILIMISYVAA